METRRIGARSRRARNEHRVLANGQSVGKDYGLLMNSVKILHRREIGSRRDRSFSLSDARERFGNICLQEEYDTKDPHGQSARELYWRPNEVIEIVAAHGVVFALLQSGVCVAFSRETNQRICLLNLSSEEVIQRIFYNKYNDSVITASAFGSDDFISLKCRTTRIEHIQNGQPDAGYLLFESELLKWPSFVEFDDLNGKVVTFSAQHRIHKVFELRNYTMLYSITDVRDIKMSPGLMMLIYTKASSHIPLKFVSTEDWSVLKSFNYPLRPKRVNFIELFDEKVFVKQEDENLRILDVLTSELTEVRRTKSVAQSMIIFRHDIRLFVTLSNRTVAVWNSSGEVLRSFEDHLPMGYPTRNFKKIYVAASQDRIIFFCKAQLDDLQSAQSAGWINICSLLTGKCLAKINADNTRILKQCKCSGRRCHLGKPIKGTEIQSTVEDALKDITAIFYDEERGELYTGQENGLLHVWSN